MRQSTRFVSRSSGAKYATTNAGLLYTAKGTAFLLVPLANVLLVETGGLRGKKGRTRPELESYA